MKITGRRIAIAGSAAPDVALPLLNYAHDLIGQLIHLLFARGALFDVGIGKEPRRLDDPNEPSIIFDWTVLEKLGTELKAAPSRASTPQGKLIATVTTEKTSGQVPDSRKPLWSELISAGALFIRSVEPGWTSGAIRRQLHAELADVLIVLSGGEGVEHLV